jgi:hypothetical protein
VIAGMSACNMQRKRQSYSEHGYNGLLDQRRGKRSMQRMRQRYREFGYNGLFRPTAGQTQRPPRADGNHQAGPGAPIEHVLQTARRNHREFPVSMYDWG